MEKAQIMELLHSQLQPVYAYCLHRCASAQDAEDVAQEILLRALHMLMRADPADPLRYLWRIAHNTLANHYRSQARCSVGIPAESVDCADFLDELTAREETRRLHGELARLSRQQRAIVVLHYFHGMKLSDIAQKLSLPMGTVKWHLFEARKELKQHMETTRPVEHLKFDPIHFSAFYNEGSIGTEGSPSRVFRSALHQNIAYACWREARTPVQIADALGVSPIYIEDAVDALAAQGYLSESGGKYRCEILLTQWDAELIRLWDDAHLKAAALIGPALAEALSPALLSDPSIGIPAGFSRSYALWALIPWLISSVSGGPISFGAVAAHRPDGAQDLITADVTPPGVPQPALAATLERFSGPCWNARDGLTLWQMDTVWSPERIGELLAVTEQRVISLLQRQFVQRERLNEEDCSLLIQRGVLRLRQGPNGDHRATMQAIWLQGPEIRQRLQNAAQDVYQQHHDALNALRQPLADALMAQTPAHLTLLRRYTLQGLFHSPRFILHCLSHLVDSGLLPLPTEDEKPSLHTIVLTD